MQADPQARVAVLRERCEAWLAVADAATGGPYAHGHRNAEAVALARTLTPALLRFALSQLAWIEAGVSLYTAPLTDYELVGARRSDPAGTAHYEAALATLADLETQLAEVE